jgi:hypothetical protein
LILLICSCIAHLRCPNILTRKRVQIVDSH